jgi:HTH-type transcriptional regulator/antitoxin HipB
VLIHNPKNLALYVSDQRKKLKLTQARAGDLVGLKQKTLSAFENNPDGTRVETLFRILAANGLEMHLVPKGEKILGSDEGKLEW